jgi:hypothetical protein
MLRKVLSRVSAIAALSVAGSCGSDTAVAPSAVQRYADIDLVQTPGSVVAAVDTVATLGRSIALLQDASTSEVVGPEGDTLEIPASGGRLIIPPGALTTRLRITMTAKAGWNVAYEFAPHGITFAVPVIVEQSLSNVRAGIVSAGTLQAGYYPDDLNAVLVDTRQSLARVTELRQVLLDRPTDPRVARFSISHFSGYIMSSGFAPGGGGSDGGDPGSAQP